MQGLIMMFSRVSVCKIQNHSVRCSTNTQWVLIVTLVTQRKAPPWEQTLVCFIVSNHKKNTQNELHLQLFFSLSLSFPQVKLWTNEAMENHPYSILTILVGWLATPWIIIVPDRPFSMTPLKKGNDRKCIIFLMAQGKKTSQVSIMFAHSRHLLLEIKEIIKLGTTPRMCL